MLSLVCRPRHLTNDCLRYQFVQSRPSSPILSKLSSLNGSAGSNGTPDLINRLENAADEM